MSMGDVPEVSDDAFIPPDLNFNDEAAGKVTEWERLVADMGDDVGEPDPVLNMFYGRGTPAAAAGDTGLTDTTPATTDEVE